MSIQSAIYAGYGAAAAILGAPCQLYHPTTATSPLSGQPVTLQAAFDTRPTFDFKQPNKPGSALWYGLFDASAVEVGDYIVDGNSTYYVASLENLHPPMMVECNRILNVLRPNASGQSGIGALPPGGDDPHTEAAVLTGWPGSMLQGTKGEKPDDGLPNNTRSAWMDVMLPVALGIEILPDDVLTDDRGQRWIVSSTESTANGWRLTAAYAGT